MKVLFARSVGNNYVIRVHLDEAKLVEGQPDPAYVFELSWSKTPPQGIALGQYLQQIKDETRLLAQARLAQLQSALGPALPLEGQTL